MTDCRDRRLPAEWEPQDGVLMAWPHAETDWASNLIEVEGVFAAIIAAISRFETVIVITADAERTRACLRQAAAELVRVRLISDIPINDTWARDYGPITVIDGDRQALLLDFGFNGWGLKFAANDDNQVTVRLSRHDVFAAKRQATGIWLEGGSIDSDGQGGLLTTSRCLLGPNRQPYWQRADYERCFCDCFGSSRHLWLDHGELAGDDTDAHVDTLARFAPDQAIVHVACDDPADEHFRDLQAMQQQLAGFRAADGRPYRLLPLPWPAACRAVDRHRLPATYANYLIINQAVLVPTYRQLEQDQTALAVIGQAYPDRQIIGIDCLPLIEQHGSLHCLTMQLPRGVLRSE